MLRRKCKESFSESILFFNFVLIKVHISIYVALQGNIMPYFVLSFNKHSVDACFGSYLLSPESPFVHLELSPDRRSLSVSLFTSFADPGSGAGLTLDPGSGAFLTLDPVFFRIPVPSFQTHIFDSLMTNFWIKSTYYNS